MSTQQREHDVDEHVARGEVVTHATTDDFIHHLDNLDSTDTDTQS